MSIQDIKPSDKEYSLFFVEQVEGSVEEVKMLVQNSIPEIKKIWYDNGEYKELIEEPLYQARYIDGQIYHNFGQIEKNNTIFSI